MNISYEYKSLKRIVKCKDNTFSNSLASKVLANILNEIDNPNLTRNVSNLIHTFQKRLKYIDKISDKRDKIYFLNILYFDKLNKVKQTNWPENVKSFTLNVLNTEFKKKLK